MELVGDPSGGAWAIWETGTAGQIKARRMERNGRLEQAAVITPARYGELKGAVSGLDGSLTLAFLQRVGEQSQTGQWPTVPRNLEFVRVLPSGTVQQLGTIESKGWWGEAFPSFSIAADWSGRVHVAWVEAVGDGTGRVMLGRIAKSGAIGQPIAVSNHGFLWPKVAVDPSGNATIAWVAPPPGGLSGPFAVSIGPPPGTQIRVARVDSDGRVRAEYVLDPELGLAEPGLLDVGVTLDGKSVVAWRQSHYVEGSGTDTDVGLGIARIGANWSAPVVHRAFDPGDDVIDPQISIGPSGEANVVFADNRRLEKKVSNEAGNFTFNANQSQVLLMRVERDGRIAGPFPASPGGGMARAVEIATNRFGVTLASYEWQQLGPPFNTGPFQADLPPHATIAILEPSGAISEFSLPDTPGPRALIFSPDVAVDGDGWAYALWSFITPQGGELRLARSADLIDGSPRLRLRAWSDRKSPQVLRQKGRIRAKLTVNRLAEVRAKVRVGKQTVATRELLLKKGKRTLVVPLPGPVRRELKRGSIRKVRVALRARDSVGATTRTKADIRPR